MHNQPVIQELNVAGLQVHLLAEFRPAGRRVQIGQRLGFPRGQLQALRFNIAGGDGQDEADEVTVDLGESRHSV